jgi:hypothetical protein
LDIEIPVSPFKDVINVRNVILANLNEPAKL